MELIAPAQNQQACHISSRELRMFLIFRPPPEEHLPGLQQLILVNPWLWELGFHARILFWWRSNNILSSRWVNIFPVEL